MQKQQDISIINTQQELLGADQIATGLPLLQPRPQADITDPISISKEFKELDIDLRTIFAQLNKTDQSITRYQRLHQAVIENISQELKLLSDQVKTISDKIQQPYGYNVYRELFHDNSSIDANAKFYQEELMVNLDLQQECIRLPLISQNNALINPYGTVTGKIKIIYQAGSELNSLNNPACSLEKAIDADPNTFYAAAIATDEPFKLAWPEYMNAKNGALCVLEIELESLQTINEIIIRPFTVYPMDIIGLIAFNTDNPNETGTILSDTIISITEPYVYSFEDTPIKRIRLIINQRHYTRNDLILSKLEHDKQKTLLNSDVSTESFIFKPVVNDLKQEDPLEFSLMTGPMSDIEKIAEDKTEKKIEITKYQYNYGLSGIELNRLSFYHSGLYISKPIKRNGNIKEVSLLANEQHQYINAPGSNSYPVTSIEYWVGDDGAWTPIMRANHEKITNEMLNVAYDKTDHKFKAILRFPCFHILKLREDGVTIPNTENEYSLIDKQVIEIKPQRFKAGSIYTIEYIPIDGKNITFTDSKIKFTEVFNGTTTKGQINLSHIPFIDKNILAEVLKEKPNWNPSVLEDYITADNKRMSVPINISIRFADGTILNQPAKYGDNGLMNVTNYAYGKACLNQFAQEQSNYQYIVNGSTIQFNTPIPSTALINVDYYYKRDSIRLKARLIRTLPGSLSYTPVIKDYSLLINTVQ